MPSTNRTARSAPRRSTPLRYALRKSAARRSARRSLAEGLAGRIGSRTPGCGGFTSPPPSRAPDRSAPRRSAPIRRDPSRFAPRRSASCRLIPRSSASVASTPNSSRMYSLNLSWSRKLRFCKSSQVIGAQLSLSPSRFAPLRDGRTDGFDSLQAFHFSTPLLRIARCSSSDMVASVSVSRGRVRLTAFVCAQCTSSRGPRHRKGSLRRPGGFSRCPNRRSRDSWVIANA